MRYKAVKPEDSNGFINVVDLEDEIYFLVCTCYGQKSEEHAELIAAALNAYEKERVE